MNVLLIDVDSKIPNLALMKISSYHKANGDSVGFNVGDPDMIYISCVFRKNKNKVDSMICLLKNQYPNALIDVGGTGYDLKKKLPDCIEQCSPDYTLYPEMDYSMGFTTRGCIRNCPFCVVPKKEGHLYRVNNIAEIYDPKFKKIRLLDNNILADRDNFFDVAQFCIEHNLKVDMSQGLDIRLLDDEIAHSLSLLRPTTMWDFAFDSLRYKQQVLDGIACLKRNGINLKQKVQFYVYCDTSDGEYGVDSAIERCNILKENNTNPWVMLNIDSEPTRRMKNLKRWANQKQIYWSSDFKDYHAQWVNKHTCRTETPLNRIKSLDGYFG